MSDIVRVKLEDGSEASVGRSFAESRSLAVLDKPATDARGRGLAAKPHVDITLTGRALDAELEAAGLPTSGRLADRQARLADHQASQVTGAPPVEDPNGGDQS